MTAQTTTQDVTATTLLREIDALGGAGEGEWHAGYVDAISEVLNILQRRGFTEQADTPSLTREVLVERLTAELGDSVDCTRVWSAWSYGTITEDDFMPVTERIDEIVDGILAPVAQVKS